MDSPRPPPVARSLDRVENFTGMGIAAGESRNRVVVLQDL
jgi:hypothetical protein